MRLMKIFKRSIILKSYRNRRDITKGLTDRMKEVIHRAEIIADKKIPDFLLDSDFTTILKWVITPHLTKHYDNYIEVRNEDERGAQRAVETILKQIEKKEQEVTEENE